MGNFKYFICLHNLLGMCSTIMSLMLSYTSKTGHRPSAMMVLTMTILYEKQSLKTQYSLVLSIHALSWLFITTSDILPQMSGLNVGMTRNQFCTDVKGTHRHVKLWAMSITNPIELWLRHGRLPPKSAEWGIWTGIMNADNNTHT